MNSWSVCGNRLKFAAAKSPNSSLESFQRTTLVSLRVKVGHLSRDFSILSKVNRSDNPAIPDSKTVDNSFTIVLVQYFIGRLKGLHSLGGNGLKVSKKIHGSTEVRREPHYRRPLGQPHRPPFHPEKTQSFCTKSDHHGKRSG